MSEYVYPIPSLTTAYNEQWRTIVGAVCGRPWVPPGGYPNEVLCGYCNTPFRYHHRHLHLQESTMTCISRFG